MKKLIFGLAAVAAFVACGGEKVIKNGDTLVFMGDSITQYGKDSPVGYLPLVAEGLKANGVQVKWHGAGFAGNTAVQMRKRFEKDALAHKPDVVTILAGVNDCSQGWPEKTQSTPDDVRAMAEMTLKAGAKPVLFSPTGGPLESVPAAVDAYAEAVKKIAAELKVPYGTTHEAFKAYVKDPTKPYTRVIDTNGRAVPVRATIDGLHMDVIGNRLIAREMMKTLGFGSEAEMKKSEAAWNAIPACIPLESKVMITAAEFMSLRVAAAKAGKSLGDFQKDLFCRGLELQKTKTAKVVASDGADVELATSVTVGLATYDELVTLTGRLPGQDNLPNLVNYALLAAVHALPVATAADLPREPVVKVDKSVFKKSLVFTASGYKGASTLKDFPVAVRLAEGAPAGFRYADLADSSSGAELRFADAKGRSLAYEVERWDPKGESLVWVKLPALAKGTKFAMYYGGKPKDQVDSRWTWAAADYVGVWHMAEEKGSVADAAANGLVATPVGHYKNQCADAGVFGKARVNAVPGLNSWSGQGILKVEDSMLLNVGGDFTFSGWIKMTAKPAEGVGRIASRNFYVPGGKYVPDWELMMTDFTSLDVYAGSATPVTGAVPSAENAWVQLAGVFDGAKLTVYANGEKAFEKEIAAVKDSHNKVAFGSNDRDCPAGHFIGLFDEFRLRDAVSSADWIKAEYDQSAAGFLSASPVRLAK